MARRLLADATAAAAESLHGDRLRGVRRAALRSCGSAVRPRPSVSRLSRRPKHSTGNPFVLRFWQPRDSTTFKPSASQPFGRLSAIYISHILCRRAQPLSSVCDWSQISSWTCIWFYNSLLYHIFETWHVFYVVWINLSWLNGQSDSRLYFTGFSKSPIPCRWSDAASENLCRTLYTFLRYD